MASTVRFPRRRFWPAFGAGIAAAAVISVAMSALAGGGTYSLSGFQIEYPYEDADSSSAAVSFQADWVSGEYPGRASCSLTIIGVSGETVGTLSFELDTTDITLDQAAIPDADDYVTFEVQPGEWVTRLASWLSMSTTRKNDPHPLSARGPIRTHSAYVGPR